LPSESLTPVTTIVSLFAVYIPNNIAPSIGEPSDEE
jgi:hypothetical protein